VSEFNYGGQAVIEGVMMRGSKHMTVAVRRPSGDIIVHSEPLNARIYSGRVSRLPFLRGLVMLWDALVLGTRALLFSADVALEEEEEVEFTGPIAWGSVALSLIIGIGIFLLGPLFLVRLATINAYESGAPLEPAAVKAYSTAHPRCGTGFLLIFAVVAIFVFSLLGRPSLVLRILSRLLLVPVIAGLTYELIKFSAAHRNNPLIRAVVLAPSLALQRLTTQEPDESMLEVAITALKRLLEKEDVRV